MLKIADGFIRSGEGIEKIMSSLEQMKQRYHSVLLVGVSQSIDTGEGDCKFLVPQD
ncbi:hypothetical protein [cyanobacterium endosymbiont of Rhopalodia gibberula]|uniref:hypothetical protein n=1 Tax=cyanobacterium endosymbiont of Rhopalodia gibberula TaxID=1763363 RepID=UPI0015590223|nr:hypothetical protein [cyanobacterium endosymbiont of Rhopalodia gibberula]